MATSGTGRGWNPSRPPIGPLRPGGYTLVELMIAASVMLVVVSTIFMILSPSQGVFRTQSEVADMQQRMRVAVETLQKDLLMAGAGTYWRSTAGALNSLIAPVTPYRVGRLGADPARGVYYRPDAISLVYVPATSSQTTIGGPIVSRSGQITVTAEPGCPSNDPVCGFEAGQSVLIFDDTGASDTFRITGIQSPALQLQHQGLVLAKVWDVGSHIARIETHTYYLDRLGNQLRHYDGWRTDRPLVDDIVGLSFRYFGDPYPPLSPKPPVGTENCLFDASGNTKLALLALGESLIELTQAMVVDGPWCGVSGNQFDADLYRIRKIRVDLRLQVAAESLRGSDPTLFKQPGPAGAGRRLVPDYEMSFEVTPRNMNLAR